VLIFALYFVHLTAIATLRDTKSVVNLFQNKTIVYTARMATILGCNFDFQWYPLDEQVCDLKLESCNINNLTRVTKTSIISYLDKLNFCIFPDTLPDTFVRYQWEILQAPVSISNVQLLQHQIDLPLEHGNGTEGRWGRSDRYPYVYLRFRFARKLGHYIIQDYIPTTLVVILTWFNFWLDMDEFPVRVALLITCMLTIVTMHTSSKGAIPPVNYITVGNKTVFT